jgi:bacterioferritin
VNAQKKIIDVLNDLLTDELSAMDQYFVHARMLEDLGYQELSLRNEREMNDEKQHADTLIRHILELDAIPDVGRRLPLQIGKAIPDILRNDLALEHKVIDDLTDAIALCEREKASATSAVLKDLLHVSRGTRYWQEEQLALIDEVGLENYHDTQLA